MALHSEFAERAPLVRILTSSWRNALDHDEISADDIATAAPLLLSSGTAALAWRRISHLDFKTDPAFQQLQEGYRLHSIQSRLHEHQLKDLFKRMRAAGVEPLLLKGWAMARLYPEPGLRPYGDIDLWVSPAQAKTAQENLYARTGRPYCVELHSAFYKQYERTVEDVLENSQLALLDDIEIRVPCIEDHLRYLCMHFLAHGAWRPLWLCDIALVVETRPADFDWDRCLAGTRKYSDWIACAIGLAHQLLSADISGTPVEERARRLPRWLVPAVLRQWETGSGMSYADTLSGVIQSSLRDPSRLAGRLKQHWRNPIQASVEMNAWFNEFPRGPLQFAAAFWRVPEFARSLGRKFRRA